MRHTNRGNKNYPGSTPLARDGFGIPDIIGVAAADEEMARTRQEKCATALVLVEVSTAVLLNATSIVWRTCVAEETFTPLIVNEIA